MGLLKDTQPNPVWHKIEKGIGKDLKLFLDLNQFKGWQEMVLGEYDRFLFESLMEIHPELGGKVIWDIGAHFGYTSMLFAVLAGDKGKVYAFEPNPYNLDRFKFHLEHNNGISNKIKLLDIALSNKTGKVRFSISSNVDGSQSTGSHLGNIKSAQDKSVYERFNFEEISVQTEEGDNLISKNILAPDIMKIDVEGAEALVLRGCTKLLEQKPTLLIEIHNVTAMYDCLQILKRYNYDTKIIDRNSASLSRCFLLAS